MRLKEGFNSQRDGILLYRANQTDIIYICFNSQRDGILPIDLGNSKNYDIGFNSQRNGILLKANDSDRLLYGLFQFPTGWNSTWQA